MVVWSRFHVSRFKPPPLLILVAAFMRPHATLSSVLEIRGKVIATRYLKTNFLPDLVSSLPYQV